MVMVVAEVAIAVIVANVVVVVAAVVIVVENVPRMCPIMTLPVVILKY